VRDHVTTEERDEAAIAEAKELLRPLTKVGSIVNWHDPASNDPRDEYQAAVDYVTALLDPPPIPTNPKQAETYDPRAQRAADEFLGTHASIVRKAVLPALRLGRPPKRKGRHGGLLRDRWIAAVVEAVCTRHKLRPYRNPHPNPHRNRAACGCSIVAEALDQLGIGLSEKSVMRIYAKHKQA